MLKYLMKIRFVKGCPWVCEFLEYGFWGLWDFWWIGCAWWFWFVMIIGGRTSHPCWMSSGKSTAYLLWFSRGIYHCTVDIQRVGLLGWGCWERGFGHRRCSKVTPTAPLQLLEASHTKPMTLYVFWHWIKPCFINLSSIYRRLLAAWALFCQIIN